VRPALLAVLLCACAAGADTPPAADADSIPALAPSTGADTVTAGSGAERVPAAMPADTLRGTVVVSGIGPTPLTTLTRATGAPVVVTGPLEPELRSLAGAIVLVHGRSASTPRPSIEALRYEIVEIDGVRPVVGTVQPGGTRLLVGDDTLTLEGLTEPPPDGSRIWVIGGRHDGILRVQSWGLIRR
jgi:hypothetical protein